MNLPEALQKSIEEKVNGIKWEQLRKTAEAISDGYRNKSGSGKSLITTDTEAAVYATVRMPATFGAVADALRCSTEAVNATPETVLDAGAGTGAASWAADILLEPKHFICLEREAVMRKLGKELMKNGSPALQNAEWADCDLIKDSLPPCDLVISSFVMNEMTEPDRESVLLKLWAATKQLLLIVEPGTPEGFRQMRKSREILLNGGAYLSAPCPHTNACRLAENDWCHFTARIQRSRLHKALKSGDAPYEDEKYCYLAFSRTEPHPAEARILRHPLIVKGQVTLTLCRKDDNTVTVIKKSDNELFKRAKKSKAGDSFG